MSTAVPGVRAGSPTSNEVPPPTQYIGWTEARQAHAAALSETVLRAREHGLAPELFHGDLLRTLDGLSTLDRELILTDAVLAYADALGRGILPVERRREEWGQPE